MTDTKPDITLRENTTRLIDVLDNVIGDPTIAEIESQPGGPDSAAVVGAKIAYEAGPVLGPGERLERLTCLIRTTVTVAVKNVADVAVGNANCYPATSPDTVTVGSMTALKAAVAVAPPGRHILIQAGSYVGGSIDFTAAGTADNPIVIRPAGARGSVVIRDARWALADHSARLVIAGLQFTGPALTCNGSHNRITRCSFDTFSIAIKMLSARDCRIDHCDFTGYLSTDAGKACIYLHPDGFDNGKNVRNRIDYCRFHDIKPTATNNGTEIIRMFAQAQNMDLDIDVCTVDHCLFEDIDLGRDENEIISMKAGGWTVQFCTFRACNGLWLNTRTANNCEIRSNWFDGLASRGACLGIKGKKHLVIGNVVRGDADIACNRGDGTADQVISGKGIGIHPRAESCRFVGNRLDTGKIMVGTIQCGTPNTPQVAALDNSIAVDGPGANIRTAGGEPYSLDPDWQKGTSFGGSDAPFEFATPLAAGDVGVGAPDPLCPTGPQN